MYHLHSIKNCGHSFKDMRAHRNGTESQPLSGKQPVLVKCDCSCKLQVQELKSTGGNWCIPAHANICPSLRGFIQQ